MDLHKKLALATLEGPLLDWMGEFGDDHPDLRDCVAEVLDQIDTERRDGVIAALAVTWAVFTTVILLFT